MEPNASAQKPPGPPPSQVPLLEGLLDDETRTDPALPAPEAPMTPLEDAVPVVVPRIMTRDTNVNGRATPSSMESGIIKPEEPASSEAMGPTIIPVAPTRIGLEEVGMKGRNQNRGRRVLRIFEKAVEKNSFAEDQRRQPKARTHHDTEGHIRGEDSDSDSEDLDEEDAMIQLTEATTIESPRLHRSLAYFTIILCSSAVGGILLGRNDAFKFAVLNNSWCLVVNSLMVIPPLLLSCLPYFARNRAIKVSLVFIFAVTGFLGLACLLAFYVDLVSRRFVIGTLVAVLFIILLLLLWANKRSWDMTGHITAVSRCGIAYYVLFLSWMASPFALQRFMAIYTIVIMCLYFVVDLQLLIGKGKVRFYARDDALGAMLLHMDIVSLYFAYIHANSTFHKTGAFFPSGLVWSTLPRYVINCMYGAHVRRQVKRSRRQRAVQNLAPSTA